MNKKARQEALQKIVKEAEVKTIIAEVSNKLDENNVIEGTYADKFLDALLDSIKIEGLE